MAGKFDPKTSGYVEVKDRIIAFYEAFPLGSIQSEVVELNENLVVMKAYAYRTAVDDRPGVGHSQMPIPGKTPYTLDSEVENAETSAWGRAIAALGFEVKRSIATSDEIEMKAGATDTVGGFEVVVAPPTVAGSSVPAVVGSKEKKATPAQKAKLMAWGKRLGGSEEWVKALVKELVGKYSAKDLTMKDIDVLFAKMTMIDDTLSGAVEGAGFSSGDTDEGEL